MTVKYKTVITKAGAEKLAAATVPNGKKVNFTAMAVGDGGGTLPVPDAGQTKLVNEVWRHALNKISQDNKKRNYVIAELLIPPEAGGFWMREMGLYDDAGTLIAVGNMAESYKPLLEEGSGRAQTVRMVIMVSDIASVELTIDTSTVMATQEYVDEKLEEHEQSRRHPDATLTAKGFTQLSSATDSSSEALAATPKAVKAAYDLASGKYTAQDATTGQKGIVQLSSATDNSSETLAATPKAVKAANDNANGRVPSARKVNGRALTNDINITSQDIGAVSANGGNYNATFRFGSVGTVPSERNTASLVSAQGGAGSIISGVAFEWYDNSMVLGLVRGDSTNTLGFAMWLGSKNLFNIDTTGNAGLAGNLVSNGSIYANYVQTSGDLRSERNISSKGIIEAGGGLYDTPGVRVYSPNNQPPKQDLSPYATASWTVANFLQGGLRLASLGVATNGNNDNEFAYAPNGTVVTAVQQKTNYTAVQYRSLQYNIGGNWYTAWVA
ncbi:phage tail protein [Enterobacter asburiae]|uniref:phage tail protein n=1 Tax=Enterobacter asburiae TaxID=61645 RepID=UPI001E601FD4|nr:phage tail protein [Enterobacter asburiae]MDS1913666.1 phage tail protein [Enterobacter asburiae]